MALNVALADVRDKLEEVIKEKFVMSELTQHICKTHPSAIIKMLETAATKIAELRKQLEDKDGQINAHVQNEGRLKTARDEGIRKWMAVVTKKNHEKIGVRPSHLSPPSRASIYLCTQMHDTLSELYRKIAILEQRVVKSTSIMDESYNWTLRQVTSPTIVTHHSTYILCSWVSQPTMS